MCTRSHGDYEVFEEIGRGARTVVYAGYNRLTKRNVAIKEFSDPNDPEQRRVLQDTAKFLAELPNYEHIVEVKDVVPENGWLILDRMRESLADWQTRENRGMPTYQVRGVLRQALEGLEILHRVGRWVGNVRPSNLLVDDEGRVKLADSPGLVADGVVRPPDGRPKYIAPERIDGSFGDVGPWTDLYSLGFTALDLLVGPGFDALFPGTGSAALDASGGWLRVHGSRSVKIPPAAEVVRGLPPDLARVIDRLLQKDVAARYPNAQAALRDLETADSPVPIEFPLPTERGGITGDPETLRRNREFEERERERERKKRKKSRWPIYAVAGVLLAMVMIVAVDAMTDGGESSAKVTIETTPAGAEITFLDTGKKSKTLTPGPYTMAIRSGSRKLRLEKEGYEPAEVELDPATTTTLAITLKPKAAPQPPSALSPNLGDGRVVVRILSQPEVGCEVVVEGVLEGKTPLELRLPAGLHRIGVIRPGGKEPVVREVLVGREPVEEVWVFKEPVKPDPVSTVDPQLALDLRACDDWLVRGGSLKEFLSREAPGKLDRWQKGVKAGNPAARVLVAHCLVEAIALERDDEEAVKHYQAASEAGTLSASYWLGVMLESGRGVARRDDQEATRLFEKAAAGGYPLAMYALGDHHLNGRGGFPKNESEAATWFRKAADKNYPPALYNLGVMCEQGLGGLRKDEAEAVKLYQRAVDAKYPRAMTNLGMLYQRGVGGLEKNEAAAVKLFRDAADAKDPFGLYNLGLAHRAGRGGLKQDDAAAVALFRQAADLNHPASTTNLGVMYEQGLGGLKPDPVEAVKLYQKAADLNHPQGMFNLAAAYAAGRGGLQKSDEDAAKWYEKAALLDLPEAMYRFGGHLETARGVPKNDVEAAKWYEKAAARGHAPSRTQLGVFYWNGRGERTKDEERAVKLYREAAELKDPSGTFNLALALHTGWPGRKPDYAEAVKWYQEAAKLGHAGAMTNLGFMHQKGLGGLKSDPKLAVEWYQKAADLEHPEGLFFLGLMHELGQGVPKQDKDKAKELYRRAADLGHKGAKEKLGIDPKKDPGPPPKTINTGLWGRPRTVPPTTPYTRSGCWCPSWS